MTRDHHIYAVLLCAALTALTAPAAPSLAARPKDKAFTSAKAAPAPDVLSVLRRSISAYDQARNVRWQVNGTYKSSSGTMQVVEEVRLRDANHWAMSTRTHFRLKGREPVTKVRRVSLNGKSGFLDQAYSKDYAQLTPEQARWYFKRDWIYKLLKPLLTDPEWLTTLSQSTAVESTWKGEAVYSCVIRFQPTGAPEEMSTLTLRLGRRDFLPRLIRAGYFDGWFIEESCSVTSVKSFPDSVFRSIPPKGSRQMKTLPSFLPDRPSELSDGRRP